MCATILKEETIACQILRPLSENPATKNIERNPTLGQWKQNTPTSNEEDQAMGEPKVLLTHSLIKNHNTVQPRDEGLKEGANECNTPKIKLTFDPSGGCDGSAQRKWANAKPFEALNEEDKASDFLRKASKALEGGCTFQGKKKHKVKIEPTCLATGHLPHLDALPSKTLGKIEVRII